MHYFRIIHCSNLESRRLIRIRLLISIFGVIFTLRSSLGGLERLLEVCNNIVDMLDTNGNSDQVLSDSTIDLFLVTQLLVSGTPWIYQTRVSKISATLS